MLLKVPRPVQQIQQVPINYLLKGDYVATTCFPRLLTKKRNVDDDDDDDDNNKNKKNKNY